MSKSSPEMNKKSLFFFPDKTAVFFNCKFFPQQFSANTTAAPTSQISKGNHILGYSLQIADMAP